MKKESNPKQAYGDMKVGLSSVPMGPLFALAVAMAEGGMKYGKHNYRNMGCKHSTYFDAAMGHLVSWWEGEDIDEESGVHHLIKAAATIFVMYDSILCQNDNDDRPQRYPDNVPLRINEAIKDLKDKYPNPVEPFTQNRKRKEEEGCDRVDATAMIAAGRSLIQDPMFLDSEWLRAKYGSNVSDETITGRSTSSTDAEIDRVMTSLFAKAGNPDFMVFEPKGTDRMTPTIFKEIEEALRRPSSDDQNLLNNVPPGYGGRPTSETEAKMRASQSNRRLSDLFPLLEEALLKSLREDEGNPKAELRKAATNCIVCGKPKDECGCHPVLRELLRHDGFRATTCKGCCTQDHCQKKSIDKYNAEREGQHCSDCANYPNYEGAHTCAAGKILLQHNPPVGDCPLFEKETV